ncbi:MAG: NAD(+)/NADH kinase [Acidimicrobiales bacterium]
MAVALIVHQERPEAADVARDLVGWLRAHDRTVLVTGPDAEIAGLGEFACDEDEIGRRAELAVSLGGDGSMLRAIDLVADDDVPVLGVNFGSLGYLTEVDPADVTDALSRVWAGDHQIEERMRAAVTVERAGIAEDPVRVLNESVVEKIESGRTVHLAVSIDGRFFTTYAADGLIVATPTGSTAYSMSARGPIVAPTHRALLLTAVAPHMLFDRTLVLEPASRLRIEVIDDRPCQLALDGQAGGVLEPGDAVTVTGAVKSARLVTFGTRDFQGILKSKFGLNDR